MICEENPAILGPVKMRNATFKPVASILLSKAAERAMPSRQLPQCP